MEPTETPAPEKNEQPQPKMFTISEAGVAELLVYMHNHLLHRDGLAIQAILDKHVKLVKE